MADPYTITKKYSDITHWPGWTQDSDADDFDPWTTASGKLTAHLDGPDVTGSTNTLHIPIGNMGVPTNAILKGITITTNRIFDGPDFDGDNEHYVVNEWMYLKNGGTTVWSDLTAQPTSDGNWVSGSSTYFVTNPGATPAISDLNSSSLEYTLKARYRMGDYPDADYDMNEITIVLYYEIQNETRTIPGDGFIKATAEKTISSISMLKDTSAVTISSSAAIKVSVEKTISSVSYLKQSTATEISGTSFVKETKSSTIQSISNIKQNREVTIGSTSFVNIKSLAEKSLQSSSSLKQTYETTIAALSMIKKLAVENTLSSSGYIASAEQEKNISSSSFILRVEEATLSSNSFVKRIYESDIISSGFIFSSSFETLQSKSSIKTTSSNTRESISFIKKEMGASIQSTSFLKAMVEGSIYSDFFIKATYTKTLSSDASIKKLDNETTLDSDMYVGVFMGGSINSRANLLKTSESTLDSDSVVILLSANTLSSDSYILVEKSSWLSSDAKVFASSSETISSSSFVNVSFSENISSDSCVAVEHSYLLISNAEIIPAGGSISSESFIINYSPERTSDSTVLREYALAETIPDVRENLDVAWTKINFTAPQTVSLARVSIFCKGSGASESVIKMIADEVESDEVTVGNSSDEFIVRTFTFPSLITCVQDVAKEISLEVVSGDGIYVRTGLDDKSGWSVSIQ